MMFCKKTGLHELVTIFLSNWWRWKVSLQKERMRPKVKKQTDVRGRWRDGLLLSRVRTGASKQGTRSENLRRHCSQGPPNAGRHCFLTFCPLTCWTPVLALLGTVWAWVPPGAETETENWVQAVFWGGEVIPGNTWKRGGVRPRRQGSQGWVFGESTHHWGPWTHLHSGTQCRGCPEAAEGQRSWCFYAQFPPCSSLMEGCFKQHYLSCTFWLISSRAEEGPQQRVTGVHSKHPEVCGGAGEGTWAGTISASAFVLFQSFEPYPVSLPATGSGVLFWLCKIMLGSQYLQREVESWPIRNSQSLS